MSASSGLRGVLPRLSAKLGVGLVIVAAVTGFGLLGPFLVGDPDVINNIGMRPPGDGHLLGTTQTGQDVLAWLAYGTQGSLLTGVLVAVLVTVLSGVFGILGAYLGGLTDEASSLLTNVMLVIPGLPLVIVISAFVPQSSRGLWVIVLVLAVTGWAGNARVLRSQTLSLRSRDYVWAAKVAGERPWRVVCVEILPNLLPLLASGFVFAVIYGILSEAGLAFLGLGASGGTHTLGTMLFYAQNGWALQSGAWWWFIPPGLMIALLGAGLSLVNFSIDEIIHPALRAVPRRRLRRRTREQAAA